jgi:hypothetical protein
VLRGLLVLLEPERDPLLPELPEPLIPPDPLELPDDPDEPWLLLSFAIRPPAFFRRTDKTATAHLAEQCLRCAIQKARFTPFVDFILM